VGGVAGQEYYLESPASRQVQHPLQRSGPVNIGIGEGIIKNHRQTTAVVVGQDLGHGEPKGGGDLLAGASAEFIEGEGATSPVQDWFFEIALGQRNFGTGFGTEELLEISGDLFGKRPGELVGEGTPLRSEQIRQQADGRAPALCLAQAVAGRFGRCLGQRQSFGRVSGAVAGEQIPGDGASFLGLSNRIVRLIQRAV
jgi:hypothetical protein